MKNHNMFGVVVLVVGIACLFAIAAQAAEFKNLNGPAAIQFGQTYTYSVTVDGSFVETGWNATGGNVVNQWWEESRFFCQVQWIENNPEDPAKIKVWGKEQNGDEKAERLNVSLQQAAPANPGKRSVKEVGEYGILRNGGNKCLDVYLPEVKKNGGKVQVWECNGEPQQLWMFDKAGRLVNKEGRCLTVAPDQVMTDGGRVYISVCNDKMNEKWQINGQGGLVNDEGYCVEVNADEMSKDGGQVQLLHCHYEKNQQWQLESFQK